MIHRDNTAGIGYTWDENISWLSISYWYSMIPDGSLGSIWVADSQYIYLGSQESLSEEDRTIFKAVVGFNS